MHVDYLFYFLMAETIIEEKEDTDWIEKLITLIYNKIKNF